MQVQIDGNKTIVFTAQGISYILDILATAPLPWRTTNALINDIMAQLKNQEGKANGRSVEATPGGGNAGDSDSGSAPVEAFNPDDGVENVS